MLSKKDRFLQAGQHERSDVADLII